MQGIRSVGVGLSGGVDSAVAAALLIRKGFSVTGLFMRNWDGRDEVGSECSTEADYESAKEVAGKLGINLLQLDFVQEYWNSVFTELVEGYKSGRARNVDVLCNRVVKFDAFFGRATKDLGLDAIATGHYASKLKHMIKRKMNHSGAVSEANVSAPE